MEEGALICLPGVAEVGTGTLQCGGMCRDQQFSMFPETSDVKDDAEIYIEIYEVKSMWGRGKNSEDGFRRTEHDETDGGTVIQPRSLVLTAGPIRNLLLNA